MKTVKIVMGVLVIALCMQTGTAWWGGIVAWIKSCIETLCQLCWGDNSVYQNFLEKCDIAFDGYNFDGAYEQLKQGFENIKNGVDEYCDKLEEKKSWWRRWWGNKKDNKKEYLQKLGGYLEECKNKILGFIGEVKDNLEDKVAGYKLRKEEVFQCITENIDEGEVCGIEAGNVDSENWQDVYDDVLNGPCVDCFGQAGQTLAEICAGVLELCAPYLGVLGEGLPQYGKWSNALMGPETDAFIEISISSSAATWALVALLLCNAAVVTYFYMKRTGKVAYKSVAFETEEEEML